MPTISTISTSQQSLDMRLVIARNNAEKAKLAQEAASGVKQDVYADNPGAATKAMQIRTRMSATESYKTSNELLAGKLENMSDSLSEISRAAREYQDMSLAGGLTSQNRDEYRQQAEITLQGMVSMLNTTYGGEFLFSGLATDTAPVEIDGTGNAVNYLGDVTGNLSMKIDDTTQMNYGIRADDPAFQDVFDALEIVLTTNLAALDDAGFEAMRDTVTTLMNDGLTKLTSLNARLGNNQAVLDQKIDDQYSKLGIYNAAVSDIETAEPEETALRLNQVMNQLEVSYQITARISGMTLLDYL